MKIYIHYKIADKPWGGGNSFLKAFRNSIVKRDDKTVCMAKKISEKYDIFLINGGYKEQGVYIDLKEVAMIKKLGVVRKTFGYKVPKIIYRLDGARFKYSRTKSEMDDIQVKVLSLSDFVIFQSLECLNSFRELGYFGSNYCIISNGVNQTLFNMLGKDKWNGKRKIKILSSAWSNNIRKGFKVISQFSELEHVESHFVGNWCREVEPKNVIINPPLEQEKLANYYRSCDVFLHAAEDDPCPNVVLEALSCGLPIIYHNSGGTPELAKKYGASLPEKISKESLQEVLYTVKENYDAMLTNIERDMAVFSIDSIVERYLKVFEDVLDGKN